MRNNVLFFCVFLTSLFSSVSAFAADKVVVVPLGGAVGDAAVEDVLSGKTFSNSTSKGITGTRPPAPVAKSGQTVTAGIPTGQDGDLQKGEPWPLLRFSTYNLITAGVGLTDFLTGLTWQYPVHPTGNTTIVNWSTALGYCNDLATTTLFGATYDDWRLPNVKELQSLIDYNNFSPALPFGHPFTDVKTTGEYWTSTHWMPSGEFEAWFTSMASGNSEGAFKGVGKWVWCVRGGN